MSDAGPPPTDPAVAAALEDAGVVPLVLPTLLGVGPVTTYLVHGDPPTLVDTGPAMLPTLDALEHGLAVCGVRIEDLGRVVVTHHHYDHFGLAGRIAARSGAEVAAPAVAVDYLVDYREARRRDRAFRAEALRVHGIAEDVRAALDELAAARSAWGAPTPVDRPLRDGDTLELGGRAFRVLARPGHSESDIVLHEPGGLLIAGDHLLPEISSNAVFARPIAAEATPDVRRNPALVDYARSLRATRAIDAVAVLPGHGAPFADHVPLVDARLRALELRAEELLGLLDATPRSAHDLSRVLWPTLAAAQASLTVSEVLGHLELLLADARAEMVDGEDGVVRFVAA
ncbi:MAG: MBL fold metallo-hydrolase [Solirubrobacteraceae bacterium]